MKRTKDVGRTTLICLTDANWMSQIATSNSPALLGAPRAELNASIGGHTHRGSGTPAASLETGVSPVAAPHPSHPLTIPNTATPPPAAGDPYSWDTRPSPETRNTRTAARSSISTPFHGTGSLIRFPRFSQVAISSLSLLCSYSHQILVSVTIARAHCIRTSDGRQIHRLPCAS